MKDSLECRHLYCVWIHAKRKLVRQSQIVQSVIYGHHSVVTQVLTPAILFPGSQLGLFPFAEYEQTKT